MGLALLACACLGASCFAQKGDTAALSARIAELSRAGKYSEAIPLAQRQVADLEKSSGPVNRDLAGALETEHAYGSRAAAAISRFHAAMAALQTETVEHVIAMRAILTPQQTAKFDKSVSETLAPPDR